MEITYTNSRRDQIAHAELLRGLYTPSLAFYHYFWVMYWGAMAALGVYVSLMIDQIFIAAIFVAMFLFYAIRAVPYSRVWNSWAKHTSHGGAVKRIRLRIDDEGLRETVDELVERFSELRRCRSTSSH